MRLALMFVVMSTLVALTGCKSDCEKALAAMQKLNGEDGSEDDRKEFLEKCEKMSDVEKMCIRTATDKKDMNECLLRWRKQK